MVEPEQIEIVEEEIAIDESEFACASLKQEMFEGDSENEMEGVDGSSGMLEEEPVTEDEYVDQEVDPEGMWLIFQLWGWKTDCLTQYGNN